jgi:CYTH domain-containing protein
MQHIEIERKFLVNRHAWFTLAKPAGIVYRQGYLSVDDQKVVRVRVAGDAGMITIKGRSATLARDEFEYMVPVDEATALLHGYCMGRVEKMRYRIQVGMTMWEVDEFTGLNEGLIIAEIELKSEEEGFEKPEWLAEEVTGDERYYNSMLAVNPYSCWENKNPG